MKYLRLCVVIALALVAASLNLMAQSGSACWYNFNTSNSGLQHNTLPAFTVNRTDGSIWVGYAGSGGSGIGMSKFHLGTWTHYTTGNSGLPNNDVRLIAADNNGTMWISCYNAGITRFDGTQWTTFNTSNSNIPDGTITAIDFDSSNKVWVGTWFEGIGSYDGTTWTAYTPALPAFQPYSCVNAIVVDAQDNVWVGKECGGGLAKLSSAGTWTLYDPGNSPLAHNSITSLHRDQTGAIWVGYLNRNIVSVIEGNNWTTYNEPFPHLYNNSLGRDGFAEDADGAIWAHAPYGMYKHKEGSWSRLTIAPFYDTLLHSMVLDNDAEGNIWWTGYGSGLWTNSPDYANYVPDEPIINTEGDSLVVAGTYDYYRWIDCETNLEIPGDTTNRFLPPAIGTYAVEVIDSVCLVRSDCVDVDVITALDSGKPEIKVYPNPAFHEVTIDLGQARGPARISIVRSDGVAVHVNESVQQPSYTLSVRGWSSGLYMVIVEGSGRQSQKLVIR